MSINILIQTLTPLYNKYRENKKSLSGTEALEIMWGIGDILKNYIEQNNIAPHNLFWSVYGRSEGTKNIAQRSYITREFQNRCYRIRKMFKSVDQIRKELPHLQSFTTFREAMPFLDNGKYQLKGEERIHLLSLLNSNQPPKDILAQIKVLQKEKIGISNPRTQRLHEVEKTKSAFTDFYNYVYGLYQLSDYKKCLDEIGNVDLEYVRILSKNVSALTQEGLKVINFDIPNDLDAQWKHISLEIRDLLKDKDARKRRRFRRIVPVERIVRLSDMLCGLLSAENFMKIRKP